MDIKATRLVLVLSLVTSVSLCVINTSTTGYPKEYEIPIADDPRTQVLNWTDDTRLTYEPAGSLLPDLAAEQENLHLVWVDWRGTSHYVHARSPYDTETTVVYSISAIDYAGNCNTTPAYSYQVTAQDVIPPEVFHEPMMNRETGREIVIEAAVTDNSQVDGVRLDYIDVKGDRFNISMNLHLDDPRYYFTYRAVIPPQMTDGDVDYFIWARDAEGITNRTRDYSITISSDDTIPPLISHNPPKTKVYGYEVHIVAKVFDNSEIESVGLDYTDVGGNPHSVAMMARGNQTYTFGIPPQPFTGTLVYTIWARDVNLNVNRTLSHSVQIVSEDKEPPTIEHTPITGGVVGYWKPIHAFVDDNFGIVHDARLNIDGGSTNMGRLSTDTASTLYYKRSTNGGRTWDDGLGHVGVDRPLSYGGWVSSPRIAVEGENIHVVFERSDPHGLYYVVSRDNGATWSLPGMLANEGHGDIAVHGDSVYVVWVDADHHGLPGRLHLSLSTDGGRSWDYWGILNHSLYADGHARIALDGQYLHVVTGEYDTPNLRYMRGTWTGNQFFWDDGRGREGEARIIANNTVPWYPPEFYAFSAAQGKVHLVYENVIPHYTRKLWCDGFIYDFWTPYYQLLHVGSPDGGFGWSSPTILAHHNGIPWDQHTCDPLYDRQQGYRIWDTDMVFDGSTVYVVWSDTRSDNYSFELHYRTGDPYGDNWSDDTRITYNESYSSWNGAIAVWGDTVHLAWTDGRQMSERNQSTEIWYKRYPVFPSVSSPEEISANLDSETLLDVSIAWSKSPDDVNGPNPVLQYELYYSTNYNRAGDGYQILAIINANGSDGYRYVHEGAGNGDPNNYFYRIIAVGVDGRPAPCLTQAAKYTRWLTSGIQLVSIPLELRVSQIDEVFRTLDYSSIWHYDSIDQTWKSCHSAKPYCFFPPVDRSMAFWINVSQDGYMTVAGIVPMTTWVRLEQGWNLVGYPSFLNDSSADVFAGLSVSRSEAYEGASLPFHLRLLSDVEEMKPGRGYWIYSQAPQYWVLKN